MRDVNCIHCDGSIFTQDENGDYRAFIWHGKYECVPCFKRIMKEEDRKEYRYERRDSKEGVIEGVTFIER